MKGPADLDIGILYNIMARIRDLPWDIRPVGGQDLLDLLPQGIREKDAEAKQYLRRHVDYLEEVGLLKVGARAMEGSVGLIKLTASGRQFVQPQLAEFSSQVASKLVSEVERKVDDSNIPESEKQGIKYRVRKAISDATPDVVAKLIVEVMAKLAGV